MSLYGFTNVTRYLNSSQWQMTNNYCPSNLFDPTQEGTNANGYQWVVNAGQNKVYIAGAYYFPSFKESLLTGKVIEGEGIPVAGVGGQAVQPWAGKSVFVQWSGIGGGKNIPSANYHGGVRHLLSTIIWK